MKKTITLIAICTFITFSCKKDTQKEVVEVKVNETTLFNIDADSSNVSWTAYKTTDKAAVKGVFSTINIDAIIDSETKQGAIEGLQFSIPVSSFFSKNEVRDTKIKQLFFGMMQETTMVTGNFFNVTGNELKGNVSLNLKMNNETKVVPMTYTITNNVIVLDGTIENLLDWKMETAFNSIHKACELLHTGADGVSKTWTDVAINAKAVIKEK